MAGLLLFWFFNEGISELSLVTKQVGMDIAILQKRVYEELTKCPNAPTPFRRIWKSPYLLKQSSSSW
jgi:hypothetical protein